MSKKMAMRVEEVIFSFYLIAEGTERRESLCDSPQG